MPHLQILAAGSIAVGFVVLGLKFAAWWLTGSVALYSDALESIVNVVTAVAAFIAVRASAKPADAQHPYGHEKAEYLSAVLEGVLIVVAAMAILRAAWLGFAAPRPLDAPLAGLLVNGLATLVNGAWATVLLREGRRHRSPALVGDGRHLLTDVVTSGGVLAGVGLVALTGWAPLDPAIAALVATNILWSGWQLLKESVGGLMDEAVPADTLARIEARIAASAEGAIEAHALRTRQAGRRTFCDFHLVVSRDMRVAEAHAICDRIEQAIRAELGEAQVTIHVEPDDEAEHAGIVMRGAHPGEGGSTHQPRASSG